ncbi:MAG TPA: DUF2088 domain-containing protein [Dehalococcoidia bacterium]|nr:DUF2088 domain-containing protein [Dehalococcoidia bacterium]
MLETENVATVPQLSWWGDVDTQLPFPEGWEVITCHMKGHDAPKLSDEGFRKAFANPIGTKTIRELARGKKDAVILFDDLSRPTKAAEIVPYVLAELREGGIKDDDIQFICAVGTHGACTAADFRKKLGSDVVARYPVYNHNPYENCTYIGKTGRGTLVAVNSEVLRCDLKVGIGSVVPHYLVGYGGGAKIIMPGVSSMETIVHNHGVVRAKAQKMGPQALGGMGRNEDCEMRLDMEDVCRMSGLDVKVDAVVNLKRDTTALFVGDPILEYDEAVKLAKEHYLSPVVEDADIVVANGNAKVTEAVVGARVAEATLPERGGTLVLISNNPVGEVPHYLMRKHGRNTGGQLWKDPPKLSRARKFILLMPYMDRASLDWLAPLEDINVVGTWDEVIGMLKADFGNKAKVAVVPDITMQYFELPG